MKVDTRIPAKGMLSLPLGLAKELSRLTVKGLFPGKCEAPIFWAEPILDAVKVYLKGIASLFLKSGEGYFPALIP